MGKILTALFNRFGIRLFGGRPSLLPDQSPPSDEEIPRYPPFMKGLPAAPVERILSTQIDLIQAIEHALSLPDDLYQTIAAPVDITFTSPFEKGGLRGIYLIKSPLTPLFQRGELNDYRWPISAWTGSGAQGNAGCTRLFVCHPVLASHRYTQVKKYTSFRQGLPESRLHGRIWLTIHGTGYPLPGGYDELPVHLCITMRATPRERKEQELRWRLAVCFAGLLHDIGKPVSDMAVVNKQGEHTWNPCDENLTDWAAQNSIDRYFLRWRENRHKRHEQFSALVIERVLTRASRTCLLARQ